MDFRKSDLDAAIELETPTLKAGTSGSFRDTLSHTLDVVKSTADKYTSSRRSLVRYRKDHPTQAHLVVQVGEENADLLERSMAAMITALGAYIADESLPSEHDSVPEFRQLDSAET